MTLGMVAAISGVGGLLVANPASGAAQTGKETPAIVQSVPSPGEDGASKDGESDTSTVVKPTEDMVPETGVPAYNEPATQAAPQPAQQSVQQAPVQTPAWSAPFPRQTPASARSRGS